MHHPGAREQIADAQPVAVEQREEQEDAAPQQRAHRQRGIGGVLRSPECEERERKEYFDLAHRIAHDHRAAGQPGRSEEHTSELQSLMRISYAVFCLKKKKKTRTKAT